MILNIYILLYYNIDINYKKIDKLLTNTQKNYLVAVVVILQTNKQKYTDKYFKRIIDNINVIC